MKQLLRLFLSFFIFPAYAVTSESYVDAAVATLQDEIPAVNGNTVLTNTGTAGEIGQKQIYNANADYASQQNALVTAETFNAAVQNAIDNEYVCIEWLGDNHDNAHCLLYQIRPAYNKSPNILCEPSFIRNAAFDTSTGILINSKRPSARNYISLYVTFSKLPVLTSTDYVILIQNYRMTTDQVVKETFVTPPDIHYIHIRNNDTSIDENVMFKIEPSTQYTLVARAIESNPSVVNGMKLQLMLAPGEYTSDKIIPCGNVYMPDGE